MNKIFCSFSCGATSAVATKLALRDYPGSEIIIGYARVREEHSDNMRFLSDCERWFGQEIRIMESEVYGGSVIKCLTASKVFSTRYGFAPCSKKLKRDVLSDLMRTCDQVVLGYTADEMERVNRFIDANNEIDLLTPLVDANLLKKDCLAVLLKASIDLPEMYNLGYSNANCVGCVKGGEGYWNKIREDFPGRFADMADLEEKLGSKMFRNRTTGERYGLKDLPKNKGRMTKPVLPDCSLFCELIEARVNKKQEHN